ncbi:molybdopterin-dependent oxidoreductase [Pedobacter aquatilis]|uniref:molybdopterin-dependent oxidoreductase n=1 Tax=Pedobacter aquatilis TaxID=351343 RepID=UPI00292F5D59|nr:molybdopterin-dependent oxidoreductase [Pedobacter aquatilis]
MKKYILSALFQLLTLTGILTSGFAQGKTEASIKISGEVKTPITITLADLAKMTRIEVSRKDRDNKDHIYSGVSLSMLLTQAGATMGKDLRGENLAKYVVVEASDGYQVLFSLAELDSEFSDDKIILADSIDNKLLPAADGPFRVIVQNDKRPARCIKQVTGIKIGFAK